MPDASRPYHYPNIAAFYINSDTEKYLENCFDALSIPWFYDPGQKQLEIYREWFSGHYDDSLLKKFDTIIAAQKKYRFDRLRLMTSL